MSVLVFFFFKTRNGANVFTAVSQILLRLRETEFVLLKLKGQVY